MIFCLLLLVDLLVVFELIALLLGQLLFIDHLQPIGGTFA